MCENWDNNILAITIDYIEPHLNQKKIAYILLAQP